MTWPRIEGLRTLELGTPGPMRQELTALVVAGRKRATAGLLEEYHDEDEPLETVGEHLVVVDDDGRAVARVAVTALEVVPFADVTDDFARAEGEGFADHADWARAHRGFWEGQGHEVTNATDVVCVRFRLLGQG